MRNTRQRSSRGTRETRSRREGVLALGFWAAVLLGIGCLGGAKAAQAIPEPNAGGDVALSLRVPEAETWVIGDAIPLYWRFSNQSTQALGFIWEGCCRLNGRLDVKAVGSASGLEALPVGQALAHMFAKADRLDSGSAKEYPTKVGDWVNLPGTGRFVLNGTYRGVLPTQTPQVPRGLGMWKSLSKSEPIELSVLAVDDYLGQTADRVGRRGLRVSMSGPSQLPPLGPAMFRVVLENVGARERQLTWPDDEALWVLNAAGRRVAPLAVISGSAELVTLKPGERLEREFALTSDRFETEALGDYQMFVDLASGGPGEPRVPSNVVPLEWRLDSAEVAELVGHAAKGAGTGARNAPLKLLRVYLPEVGKHLAELDRSRFEPEARLLADRLLLASRIRPLAPRPGEAGVPLAIGASGELHWGSDVLRDAFAADRRGFREQVAELLTVRRHLGWDVTLVLVPDDSVRVERLGGLAGEFGALAPELAGPVELRWDVGGTNGPVRVSLGKAGVSGALEPDMAAIAKRDGGGWKLEIPGRNPEGAPRVGVGYLRVAIPGDVTWGELRAVLAPNVVSGGRLDATIVGNAGK